MNLGTNNQETIKEVFMKIRGTAKILTASFMALVAIAFMWVGGSSAMGPFICPNPPKGMPEFCTGMTVLGMGVYGRTDVVMSGSSSTIEPETASPAVKGYYGNVGLANGNFSMSGASLIEGAVYIDSMNCHYTASGESRILADPAIIQDATVKDATGGSIDLLEFAVNRALTLSRTYAPLTGSRVSNMSIKGKVKTLTAACGNNYFDYSDLVISGGGTLILKGESPCGLPPKVVINVTGKLNLSGASDILVTNLPPTSVLINVVGPGSDVVLSAGSTVAGILLAPERKVTLSGGSILTGEIAAGGSQVVFSGASKVIDPCPPLPPQ